MNKIQRAIAILFLLALLCPQARSQTISSGDSKLVDYINNLSQTIQSNNRLVADLQSAGKSQLPVGIVQDIAGKKVMVCVDTAHLTPQGAMFNAYAAIRFPQTNQLIAFAAKNLSFNPGGIGGSSQARLMLVSEVLFPVFNNVKLHLPSDGSNYVEWDCNGFKNVHLKGEFIFDRSLIVPDSVPGAGSQQVTAPFEILITDPNNFLITASISPFALPGTKDLSFSVYQLTADFSDVANPPGAVFPQVYQQEYGSDINLWRGFYIKDISVGLPAFVGKKTGRTTVQASNFIIDDQGVSGTIAAKNLLQMDESTSSWPMSVNDISIQLIQSRLVGGGMSGKLNIPFLGNDSLQYAAGIAENTQHDWDYRFMLQLREKETYSMPLGGTLVLDKNSAIEFGKINGLVYGKAMLNGTLNINQPILNVKGVKFEQLELVTQAPYLVNGKFNFACDTARLSNFPISFSSISLNIASGKFNLGCVANMNILNQSDNSASVSVGFHVYASANEDKLTDYAGKTYTRHRFAFIGIDVNKIHVDVHISAFAVNGNIDLFRNDPTFGNGFRGALSLTIPLIKNPLSINAMFGSMPDYRYFHFDIYAPTGKIPIVPGVLNLTGIIGGVSYHMVKVNNPSDKPDLKVFNAALNDKQTAAIAQQDAVASATDYLPDVTTGLHLMGGVILAAETEKAFNGNAILEMAFRSGGGLRYIQFTGVGYFMQDIQGFDVSLPEFDPSNSSTQTSNNKPNSSLWAKLQVLYDNDNQVFHANLNVYLNIANVIKGIDDGMIGDAVIHFDSHDWYIYIGRPSHPAGVDIARIAQAQSYFMMGSKIESIPPPPQEISQILGETNLDIGSALDAYATGRGIAFGARIKINIDVNPVPFFASIQVGAGADIMLRQYGGVHCKGNNSDVGWNGWYASGQAYAYLQAKAGIKVGHKQFSIFSAGLAALLQAQLPNPSWFKGEFGGNYSVLCGLVKGHFKIKFTIGDQCELVSDGSEIGDIKVIQDIKPDDKLTGVDVFTYPQVSFNTSVEQEMRMMNMDNQMESYRIKLDECKLYNGSQVITGSLQWNHSNDVVSISTPDVLPPQQNLRFHVKIHWEKKMNGAWQPLMNENGTPDTEDKTITFTTGNAPTTIPESNVAYSYPVKQQYNFHPKEYAQGYMQLKKGQPYLFNTSDSSGTYNLIARFTPSNGAAAVEKSLTYNESSRQIYFDIPQEMALATIYNLDFVKRPVGTNTANDRNVTKAATTMGNTDNSVSITSNKLSGTIVQSLEHNMYNSFFRSSNYASFSDKWNSITNWQDLFDIAIGNLYVIAKIGTISETFDEVELYGKDSLTPSMIQPVATTSSQWYSSIQNPLLYELYGSTGLHITWRDEKDKGIGPLKAVSWSNLNTDADYYLTDNDLQNGFANAKGGRLQLGYYLSYYAFKDFIDLRNAAAYQYLNGNTGEATRRLLSAKGYTDLLPDNYPVQINYTLPGIKKVTTSKQIDIKF